MEIKNRSTNNTGGRKIIKVVGLILGGILCLTILFLGFSIVNHKIHTAQELEHLKNYDTGATLEVDGRDVNYKVFNPEKSEQTIILMAGLNTQNLTLAFEPLANKLNYRVILIDRPGYGFSEDTNENATNDYIVNFYRKTLSKLGVGGRYFLMPSSIAGVYATYWAEKYPEEIAGIIGLDITVPDLYDDDEITGSSPFKNTLLSFAASLGIHRFVMLDDNSKHTYYADYLSKIEIFDYDEDFTDAMWEIGMANAFPRFAASEDNLMKENMKEVVELRNTSFAEMKKLYIIADIFEEGFWNIYRPLALSQFGGDEGVLDNYVELKRSYDKQAQKYLSDAGVSFAVIPGPHIIYEYPSDELAESINVFVESIGVKLQS